MAKWLVTFLFVIAGLALYAQSIKGVVIDSVHTTYLQSTSISVFEMGQDKVSKIALSDRYGKFVIEYLPIHKNLVIEWRHQGYSKMNKIVRLSARSVLDLGKINMSVRDNHLDTVEILPPVRMNGDTLEFNADAFKLDSNAVVQDLLHKLPGLMLWGDDKITYNGKELQNIWVNGKPFFGSDKSIALQNIAKDAVKKIQVYDSREKTQQLQNPDDTNYAMNVVLKDGREKMFFGNLTAGYGTDKRHDTYLTANYGDKQRQATLAFSKNNSNKNIVDLNQLLENTTFKGVGLNNDFSSDFLSPGITRQTVAGARYQHDFLPTGQTNRNNIFTANLFYNNSQREIRDSAISKLIAEENPLNNSLTSTSAYNDASKRLNGSLTHQFSNNFRQRPISMNSTLDFFREENSSSGQSGTQYDYTNNKSFNNESRQSANNKDYINFQTGISIQNKIASPIKCKTATHFFDPFSFYIDYQINRQTDQGHREVGSQFTNYLDSAQSRNLVRAYMPHEKEINQIIKININYKNFGFKQHLSLQHLESDNLVRDNDMIIEDSLTHQSKFNRWIYQPSLTYKHSLYSQNLVGRKNSHLSLNMQLGTRWQGEKNESTLAFRNIKQHFVTILPEISVEHFFSRVNFYQQKASISYKYNEDYPELDRLRPFYDNINPSFRYFGAKQLKKVNKHVLSALLSFSQSKQYGLIMSLSPSFTWVHNGFADSITNKTNQIQYYAIQNTAPTYVFNVGYNVEKAVALRRKQSINFSLRGNISKGNNYQYMDGIKREVNNWSSNLNLNTYYTNIDHIVLGFINTWQFNKQSDKENGFLYYSSHFLSTGLSASLALSKRWSINSNVNSRYSRSTFSNDHVLIWSANTSYRVLKGNNLEFKLAAYDLLKQNKGIYFRQSSSEFTTGYLNNLTQYFMVSLSYYPRKFGL